jgi:hypothetical protein
LSRPCPPSGALAVAAVDPPGQYSDNNIAAIGHMQKISEFLKQARAAAVARDAVISLIPALDPEHGFLAGYYGRKKPPCMQ